MKKISKQFRKQAKFAERTALRAADPAARQDMLNLAEAYKAQVKALKAKAKTEKRKN
jgi:hypothetical protein